MAEQDKLVTYRELTKNDEKFNCRRNLFKERTAMDDEDNNKKGKSLSEKKNPLTPINNDLSKSPVETTKNEITPSQEKKYDEIINKQEEGTMKKVKKKVDLNKTIDINKKNDGKIHGDGGQGIQIGNIGKKKSQSMDVMGKCSNNLKSVDNPNLEKRTKKNKNNVNIHMTNKKKNTVKCGAKEGPIELCKDTLVGGRFLIKEKIGAGGCGAVYQCFDNVKKKFVALKAETNTDDGSSVLKFEVKVLQNLDGRRNVVQLISFGKKETYSWIVMTLLGYNIYDLRRDCDSFSYSTIARIGIQILYGLKELHEAGFIHRDVKPQNMAIGGRINTMKTIHLLDFGLSREYIILSNGVPVVREQRSKVLFRGTSRYCSINAQKHNEQGRNDDLWSLLYVLGELVKPLPWSKFGRDKMQILKSKENTLTRNLFPNFPEMEIMSDYLETLNYYSKPKYSTIFQILNYMLISSGGHMSDFYDWENHGVVKIPEEYAKAASKLTFKEQGDLISTPVIDDKKLEQRNKKSSKANSSKNSDIYTNILNELNEFYVYETFANSKTRY